MFRKSFWDEDTGHWSGKTNLQHNGIRNRLQTCFDILEDEGFHVREIAAVLSQEIYSVSMIRVLKAGVAKKRAAKAQKLLDKYHQQK